MPEWKCQDGRVLKIVDMADGHLRNTIRMLRRNGYCTTTEFADCAAYATAVNGEYAALAAENEMDQMRPASQLDDLIAEADRRGLKI